jgi:beta-phosphoglucomutase-like phosphatase (HAD superfamily)
VDALMRAAGLADFLSFTLSNQDVLHPKPHPEIYIKAIQLANVQPHQCVVVEDNPYGVRAASRAGARVLTVEHVSDVTYDNITQFIQGLGAAKPGQREAA